MEYGMCTNDDDPFWANECYQLRSEYAAFPDHLWQTRDDKTYTMLCIEEFTETQRKLEDINKRIIEEYQLRPMHRRYDLLIEDMVSIIGNSQLVKNSEE